MNPSVWLMAATLAAGAPGEAPTCAACQASVSAGQQLVDVPQDIEQGSKRISLFDRLANRLHLHRPSGPCSGPANPAPPLAAQPLPTPSIQTVSWITPPGGVDSAVVKPSEEVKKEFQNKIGHADDYSWITGQLCYVHAGGGLWVLRYAGVNEEDRYGGSVVLSTAVSMKNFREGDLVSVSGDMLNEGRASKYLGGPLYRASTVEMIERADP